MRLLIPAAFLTAAAVSFVLFRAVHFPDIGDMPLAMNETQLDTAAVQMTQMEIELTLANRILYETHVPLPEIHTVNRHWVELDKAWFDFRDRPVDLNQLNALSRAFEGMVSSLKDLRKAAELKKKAMSPKGERFRYHIDMLTDLAQNLKRYTVQNMRKRGVLSEGAIPWILSFLAGTAASGIALFIVHRMGRRVW